MNLKITLQTLRRIEQLLDGWQSSGDIPAIERDLACDLLRRAYDDICFSDKSAATAPEAPLAENTSADRTNEEAVGEAADTPAGPTAAADDTLIADVASPIGLTGLASAVEAAETPEEMPEKAEAVAAPAGESAPMEVPAEMPAEEDTSVEIPVDEPAFVETPVEAAADAVLPAEDVVASIPEMSADIVIDPVFEVFTDEDEAAEEPDGAEKPEDTYTSEAVDLVDAVAVAEETETAEEIDIVEELEAEETEEAGKTEVEPSVAAPAAMQPAAMQPAAATVEAAAKPEPESVMPPAPAETSAEGTPADAAASNAETLEEMAARFKNASGRRRKSRRAFMSLYDDDETPRRGAQSDQLELSDWGVEPSDTSAKLRHTRELFGLPADDPDTTPEPTPQPAADADADDEMEVEVIDFVGDDHLAQSDQTAKPAPEPTAAPTAPAASHPTVEPALDGRDDAEDDLPLDSIEVVEIADNGEETPEIDEDETQHADRAEVADEPSEHQVADSAPFATEQAAAHTLYGHGEKPEMPASTPVLGEVMGHDVPTVGDSLGHRPDVAGWTEVADDLNHAISVGDRFVLLRDLFDGDQALCDRTLKRLSTFDDLDDCMIWITENFAWNANSEGAKLIMGLLERKLG